MSFGTAQWVAFFIFLIVFSVFTNKQLNEIEDLESSCVTFELDRVNQRAELRHLQIVRILNELRGAEQRDLANLDKQISSATKQFQKIDQSADNLCSEIVSLKNEAILLQSIVTALIALIGLFLGFAAGKSVAQPKPPTPKMSEKKPRVRKKSVDV